MGIFAGVLGISELRNDIRATESWRVGYEIESKLKKIDGLLKQRGTNNLHNCSGVGMTIGEHFEKDPISCTRSSYKGAVFYQQLDWLYRASYKLDEEIDRLQGLGGAA